jgi:hypothetical protein
VPGIIAHSGGVRDSLTRDSGLGEARECGGLSNREPAIPGREKHQVKRVLFYLLGGLSPRTSALVGDTSIIAPSSEIPDPTYS